MEFLDDADEIAVVKPSARYVGAHHDAFRKELKTWMRACYLAGMAAGANGDAAEAEWEEERNRLAEVQMQDDEDEKWAHAERMESEMTRQFLSSAEEVARDNATPW